jgi:IclR family transcriptional regulator, mhp operon transcriptional activator
LAKKAQYKHVRALARGLDILRALNQVGSARPRELSVATGVDRTTVYRVLETLKRKGYVVSTTDESYTLGLAVRHLSDGFTDADWIVRVVAPELGKLLPKVLWPTDFGTFERGVMIIRETTHRLSRYSIHRSMIGKSRPVTRTAIGRAVLSALGDEERELMLRIISTSGQPDAAEAKDKRYIRAIVEDTRRQGYAAAVGIMEENISAIALPVRHGKNVVGALNLIFFRKVMTPPEAAGRYLDHMRKCIADIETHLRNYEL